MEFDDCSRLRALADYRVLDSAPEESFDNLAKLAARIFDTPIALVSLVAEKRQWFKAHYGLDWSETPREYSLCDHAIRADATLLVPDTRLDPRFADNALVLGEPHIRFYCGVPLRTPEGHGLGTLCIIDREPRSLTPPQLSLLAMLGRQVELELEIRRRLELVAEKLGQTVTQARSRELLASMIVHDLRGPLTAIGLLAASIEPADADSAASLDSLMAEADRVRRMLVDILDVCLHEMGGLRPRRQAFSLARLARDVARRLTRGEAGRNASVQVEADEATLVDADPELIERVLENLVSNGIQHAPGQAQLRICFQPGSAGRLVTEISDSGSAIPEQERSRIFDPLAQGSTSTRRGHGLGLAFCRLAVEAHGGSIGVRHNVDGVGNTFSFDLPTYHDGSAR